MARELNPRVRVGIWIALVAVAVGIMVVAVQGAVTGNESTSQALPDSVERLIPEGGSEVLRQSAVGVDLATGYDAYLVVNGKEIKTAEDGLSRDLGTGLVTFQPGKGRPLEELAPERNCVQAMVWKQSEGQKTAKPVYWCFNAS